jgi:putative ABC transport system permease protein
MRLWQDLTVGGRLWLRRPAFAAAALATIAIGVGATTAIFSLVNAVLLRPLPYPDSADLYQLRITNLTTSHLGDATSPLNFLDERAAVHAFASLGAYQPRMPMTVASAALPERLLGARVSDTLLPTLGLTPAVGRAFTAAEDGSGVDPSVVIISDRLAMRRFGRPDLALGRSLTIDLRPHTVIGVMSASFAFPTGDTDLWIPFGNGYVDGGRGNFFVDVIGRLRRDASVPAAAAELRTIAAGLARAYPESNVNHGLALTPLREYLTGRIRSTVLLLLGAAALVLVVACANVAGLLLVSASRRRREMAVRRALGAGRLAIVRQLLSESLVLAIVGGLFGLLVALWMLRAFTPMLPPDLPTVGAVSVDARVFAFAAVVALLAGVLFGLAPVGHAAGLDVIGVLRGVGRGSTDSRSRTRWLIVAAELSLSVVLLVGAGLLVRSLWQVLAIDPGFTAGQALVFDVRLPWTTYDRPASGRFFAQALDRLAALPGVTQVAATTILPLRGEENGRYFTLEGRVGQAPRDYTLAAHRLVSADYFAVLGIAVTAGRAFTTADFQPSASPTVVVNAAFVRTYLSGVAPLGRRLKVGETAQSAAPWMTVVGVVADVHHASLEATVQPELYRPFTQTHEGENERKMTFVLRTTTAPEESVPSARRAIHDLNADVPIAAVATFADVVDSSLRERRFTLRLVEAFSLVAVLLTAIGLYGVMSYTVEQQARAIGVRLALGATGRDVMVLVLGSAAQWTALGVGVGLVGALAVSRLMTTWLFGVRPTDPASLGTVVVIVTGLAAIACYLPARRAAAVDPMVALRND